MSAILSEREIRKQHCGLIAADIDQVAALMPDLLPICEACPQVDMYRFDIKVHMLMPGQWPCIPNWHFDFIPRDADNTKRFDLVEDKAPSMYMLLSGPPLTEFKDGRVIKPWQWISFTQRDEHRGVKSTEYCWRVFIRSAHTSIVPTPALAMAGLRRHSQVYIEPDFTW